MIFLFIWAAMSFAIAIGMYQESPTGIPRMAEWLMVIAAPLTIALGVGVVIYEKVFVKPINPTAADVDMYPPEPKPDEEWPLPTDAEVAMQMAYMPNVASGHIIAWKSWSLQNGYLKGMFGPCWTPNLPYVAVNMQDHHMYGAGIHAAKDEIRSGRVYGQVALWGQVIEHERGYRARYAYPIKLYVQGTDEEAKELGQRYNVECEAIEPQSIRIPDAFAAYQNRQALFVQFQQALAQQAQKDAQRRLRQGQQQSLNSLFGDPRNV